MIFVDGRKGDIGATMGVLCMGDGRGMGGLRQGRSGLEVGL